MRTPTGPWALLLLAGGLAGCATAPAATPDRYSPAEMKHGPSLYETGRIAVVPPSSNGLRIDEGSIDRRSTPQPPVAERAHGKRKVRARASQAR
jgi:hypothetical protein